ncbi:hypothetical protein GFH30_04035 [Acinetobacter wanghuae]|uniref:Trimeric autotransporter adhesin YadA-like C-terminal membrane anchor domain-containing protein n=1 Tax=Acinetobacter wanghuae TaxID=2662362 RepID=A0A5Q0P4F5_9GAMM|nr:YadA C-terminal domain-containing protein [Acinetobacter wanghuae]MQW93344.1 hypothetical protein [Acinetobacter wanghuae]QGA10618.1 hypothetical protein GFH30_04035 [Acinetobacter wanghuae]
MKLNTAFKLSTLALALASTSSVFAATLDTSELGNDIWTDPRGPEVGNIDPSLYQYVDVGTGTEAKSTQGNPQQNNLTSWYSIVDKDGNVIQEIIKIETPKGADSKTYNFYDVTNQIDRQKWLDGNKQSIDSLTAVDADHQNFLSGIAGLDYNQILEILTVPETDLKNYTAEQIKAVKDAYNANKDLASNDKLTDRDVLESGLLPTNLGGVTGNKTDKTNTLSTVKRLDSTYLEYAELAKEKVEITSDFGNLTDKDVQDPQVWLTINTPVTGTIETTYDRGVINGIINTDKKGHLNNSNKYVKHFSNLFDKDAKVTDNVYGLVASEVKTVTTNGTETKAEIDRYTAVTQAGVVVSDEIANTQTVITSEGITTGKLTVGGVDVGSALGNAAALGGLSKEQLDSIIDGGEQIASNTAAIADLQTEVSNLDTKVDTEVARLDGEVERLDGRIDRELAANATASTEYTDKKAIETLAAADTAAKAEDAKTLTAAQDFAKTEDAKTLKSAQDFAKSEDAKTLAAANDYTDAAVAGFNTRVGQLNNRIDDVEKTAYRGIAIALAAQQQVPNIGAGQFAVFGGVGHYEGETAGALGVASVFADGRTSVSAALGVAGGSEVGGRVGVAYVFGGK